MSDYFLGEIRMFPFNWAPTEWALCDGSLLPVNQNTALYSLLGNAFGGNAPSTFGLPDLRGRAPLSASTTSAQPYYPQGNSGMGGVESIALTTAQAPIHTHSFRALSTVGAANQPPAGGLVSSAKPVGTTPPSLYGAAAPNSTMAPLNAGTINPVGGNAHNNMQPFLVMNFCIATRGIYPPRQ